MHCINTSHPEYLELLAKTNFSQGVLQAKIGAWMAKNTSERFPSVEELLTSNNLENRLKTFFTQFGFEYKEGESSTDLLRKIIYTSSKDSSVFINNSVKALSQLLLANTNIDFHKLETLIDETPEFKKLFNDSSDYVKNTYNFLKEGNRIPMEEWISYIKEYNKIKNEVLEKYIKESLLDSSNSSKLHKAISNFINWFKNLFANAKNLKQVTDSLIQQVLLNQKGVIINSKDLQNKERVTLAKALEETAHGKNIIKTFGEFGLILTGSISAAEQGTVFRKTGKLLHDIDWVVPKGFSKNFNSKLLETFPGAKLVREFDSATYYTQTYIVPPKGYTISNLTFFKPEIYGKNKYIASYDVLDLQGNVVSNYRRYYNVKESGKVVEDREVYNEGLQNVDKNLEAVSVDFFQNKEDLKFQPYTVNVEGINLQLSHWLSSFTEKLKYGRAKDLLDYANFIPNDVLPLNNSASKSNAVSKNKLDNKFYQTDGLNSYQREAKKIYFEQVYKKKLSEADIENINAQLRYQSRLAGDENWSLRLSKNGNYYVAGYKNFAVTSPDYYSPNSKIFRQKESSSRENAIKDLNDKLKAWATKNGISIQALNNLKERFKDRYPDGILGVADIANLIIGLSDNLKVDTLPEEVGHFAVEMLMETEAIKRALALVENTEEYAAVKEEYKGIYTNEIDFKKEALGKIIAKEIVNQYKTSKEEEGFLGAFKTYIKSAVKSFLNWVNKTFKNGSESRSELTDTIIPIAKSILANEKISTDEILARMQEVDEVFPQLDEESEEEPIPDNIVEKKKKFLINVQEKLIARKDKLARSVKNTATIDSLEREIKQLQHDVARGELDLAISNLFTLASKEINTIEEALNKRKNNLSNINPNTLVTSEDFLDMYQNIFQDFLKDMYDANIPFEELEDFENIISNIRSLMDRVRGKLEYLQRRASIDFLNKGNTDHNGNIIDPDFNAEEVYDRTNKDMSYYRLQVGNYKNADSSLIRIAHKIVFDSIAVVKRFAAQKANTILRAQELFLKAGFNTLDLVEKDSNGKPTNYLIREYHWGKYYEAMAKTRQDIADALGFESFSDIAKEFLSKEDAATYKAHWKDFFKNHSKEKVEMVTLETGEVVKVTTKVPNDSYINHEYHKLMANPAFANYYNTLVESKKEALRKLPVQYRTDRFIYSVPPILNSTLDELTNTEKGFLKRISALASRALLIDEDDTMFGQLNVLNNKMVPIFFTGKLKDTRDLSYDFGKTFTLFSEMAENFMQMNKIAGELGVIQKTLARREYEKKNIIKKGVESNEYKALETLLDTHVFGIERSQASVEIPSNKLTEAVGIAGKKFSWTKASQRFSTFIRDNNLVLNITTSLAGYLKGTGDTIIEDITGVYTTNESKMWARQEFLVNMPQVLSEVGKAKQNNKMHLLLQENEVVDLDKIIRDSRRSRVVRKLATKELLYTNYATGDYGLKGRVALAIYDNYRLYDGKFLNREEYLKYRANKEGKTLNSSLESEYKSEWKTLREKSLYNAFEVVKGELKVKSEFEGIVTDSLLARVKGRINHMTNYIDGTLSASDKGALSRHWSGDYLLMHRGWFIGLVDTRFQREKFNYQTGQRELGSYRATGDLIFNKFFATLIKEKNLKAAFASWDTLTPGRKAGVRRTVLDGIYLALVSFVAALANIAADDADDEDFTTQYMAYQLNRLLLEQGAAWSPAELIQMIDEPVVGARMIKDIADIFEAFNTDEVYESGMYEGKSHAAKWWMKKLPTRNLYELQFPELKNRFIKQLVDSKTYELLKPDEANTIGKTGVFRSWLVPRDLASDGTDADETQNMNNIVDSWASDEDEENAFN